MQFPKQLPILGNDRVKLREFDERDVPAWFERLNDREAARLAGDPRPESIEVCHEWLEGHRTAFANGKGLRWAIVPAAASDSIGSVGLSVTERGVEIGAAVGRAHWNRGYATEAARLVLDYAFNVLDAGTVWADLLAENVASRRVLEKIGFVFDSELPEYDEEDGTPLPGYLYRLDALPAGTGRS